MKNIQTFQTMQNFTAAVGDGRKRPHRDLHAGAVVSIIFGLFALMLPHSFV
jgi:hypothetical protein